MAKKIKLDPRNARSHPDRNRSAVEKSLRELGAGRSIVVDRDGVIVGGNAVYEQAVKLGIPVKEIETNGDELIVVRRVDLATDDPRRKALALADNQIGTLGEWDDVVLGDLLGELEDIDFDVMGFGEMGPFAIGENDADEEWQGMPEFEQEDKSGFRKIIVHFNDQAGVDEFAALVGQKLSDKTRYMWFPEAELDKTANLRYESES